MTSPIVTELVVRLEPVEHDDFIDRLDTPRSGPTPASSPAGSTEIADPTR